jgi:hypothetical protein
MIPTPSNSFLILGSGAVLANNGTIKFQPLFPLWLSALWKPKPPEHIDHGRPTRKHKHDTKQQQLAAALDKFAKGPSLKNHIFHHPPSLQHQKFLLGALQIAASLSSTGIPNFSLSCDHCLRNDLLQHKQKGY